MAEVITRPGSWTVPYTYRLAVADELTPSGIFAHFDGSAAATAYLPCVTYYTQDGKVFARAFPDQSVAAGASADVSWFPGLSRSPAGAGAIVKLYDSLLAVDTASFSVTGISQAYSHLWIVASLRGDTAATASGNVRLNGDAGTNYEYADSTGTRSAGLTSIPALRALDPAADAGHFGVTDVLLHDYSIVRKDHALHGTWGVIPITATPAGFQAVTVAGQHCAAVAAAVTSLTVLPSAGGNFVAGSRLQLYGVA